LEYPLHEAQENAAPAQTRRMARETSLPGGRSVLLSMYRGLCQSCPACGARTLYSSYLRVADRCTACGEALMHHRADDAPPYFTILIAGHIVIPLLMMAELAYAPPIWLHLLIWVPFTVVLCLALLPRVKGAIVGLQWAQGMHGFERDDGALLSGPGSPDRMIKIRQST